MKIVFKAITKGDQQANCEMHGLTQQILAHKFRGTKPMDYSLPGSSIHGIFQARGLEWGATVPFKML